MVGYDKGFRAGWGGGGSVVWSGLVCWRFSMVMWLPLSYSGDDGEWGG